MTTDAEDWGEHDLDRRFALGPARDEITGLAATLDHPPGAAEPADHSVVTARWAALPGDAAEPVVGETEVRLAVVDGHAVAAPDAAAQVDHDEALVQVRALRREARTPAMRCTRAHGGEHNHPSGGRQSGSTLHAEHVARGRSRAPGRRSVRRRQVAQAMSSDTDRVKGRTAVEDERATVMRAVGPRPAVPGKPASAAASAAQVQVAAVDVGDRPVRTRRRFARASRRQPLQTAAVEIDLVEVIWRAVGFCTREDEVLAVRQKCRLFGVG